MCPRYLQVVLQVAIRLPIVARRNGRRLRAIPSSAAFRREILNEPVGNSPQSAAILEIFGAGHPLGAVAVYENVPLPASALALETTSCMAIARLDFFRLLEERPL